MTDERGLCNFPAGTPLDRPRAEYHLETRGWRGTIVAGHHARTRDGCGYVDAVVVAGARIYVISAFDGRRSDGPWELFDRFAGGMTLEPDRQRADGLPPLGEVPELMDNWFVSRLNGYAIAYPIEWTPSAATVKWSPRAGFVFPQDYLAQQVDVISQSRVRTQSRFQTLWVAASPIAPDRPVADWAAERLPGRMPCPQNGEPGTPPVVGHWSPRVVRGYPAVEREVCGFVDVVIDLGDRVLVVSASDTDTPRGDKDGRALFEAFLLSLRFQEDPSPERPTDYIVTSALYGYRITPQVGAVARLATEPWDGIGVWDETPMADHLSVDGQLFTVVAVDVERGTTARTFVDAHGLDRPRVFNLGMGYCKAGGWMIPGLTADRLKWNPDLVAGRDAMIRAACGHVDAVVIASGNAWVLHSATRVRLGADIEAFRRVADTIEFP
jgi:hypothetical protein